MNMKVCRVCENKLNDGDKVITVMVAQYHAIPSEVNVAIGHPEKCVEIIHIACYDFPDLDSEEVDA